MSVMSLCASMMSLCVSMMSLICHCLLSCGEGDLLGPDTKGTQPTEAGMEESGESVEREGGRGRGREGEEGREGGREGGKQGEEGREGGRKGGGREICLTHHFQPTIFLTTSSLSSW